MQMKPPNHRKHLRPRARTDRLWRLHADYQSLREDVTRRTRIADVRNFHSKRTISKTFMSAALTMDWNLMIF